MAGIPTKWADFIDNSDLTVSSEMIERGTPGGLVMGLAIAVPSGFGVTLAVTTAGGINALVGVAISASLVPPIVNAGICTVTGIYFMAMGGSHQIGMNFMVLGLVSITLFLMNIIVMTTMGVLMMRIKKVSRVGATLKSWDLDMFYDDNRSSFFRSGVEMRTAEERLLDSGEASNSSSSNNVSIDGVSLQYTSFRDEEDDDEEEQEQEQEQEQGKGKQRGGRAGSLLKKFLKNPKNDITAKDEEWKIAERRDSVDAFSPNNFKSDMRQSITFEDNDFFGGVSDIIIGGDHEEVKEEEGNNN